MTSAHPPFIPHHLHSAYSAGAGGGDEDPNNRNPIRLKSSHEEDEQGDQLNLNSETQGEAQPKRIRKNDQADPCPASCPVCQRVFKSAKALHGHMRSHPDRTWRGMSPPEMGQVMQAKGVHLAGAETDMTWQFRCRDCGASFRTKQALGGHRASHKSKKGCYMKWREGLGSSSGNISVGANVAIREEVRVGNNNNNNNHSNNNNNNLVIEEGGNNGGGEHNRREELGLGLRLGIGLSGVDLNLPPPQEEEEGEEEEGEEEQDERGK